MKKIIFILSILVSSSFSAYAFADVTPAAVNDFLNFTAKAQSVNSASCSSVTYKDSNFCNSFTQSTACQCYNNPINIERDNCYIGGGSSGTPNMPWIYNNMVTYYGGYMNACTHSGNYIVSPQNCQWNWECYMTGYVLINGKKMPCAASTTNGCPGHP